jgi:dihydrofolate synthase/folylpolyglutamate synthase
MNPAGSFRSLDDWLPWLETLSPREIVLGLERVHTVLERLDLARADLVINVAGTNGKGSSVAMLEALLRQDGRKTACYTSPHVSVYNERIRIDGTSASDTQIVEAFRKVESVRGDVPLTYFEFGTLAALVAFAAAGADILILEIGMGGRLDAVNAVEPDGCLITNVTLDHCAWLGDNIESIAAEKAGVMRAGKPCVFGSPIVPLAIRARASDTGAPLLLAGDNFSYQPHAGNTRCWSWRGQHIELDSLQYPVLKGAFQLQNAAAVLALLEALHFDHLLTTTIVDNAFQSLQLPGRFQVVEKRQKWILDVAHNADSARVLSESLAEFAPEGAAIAVVGMLADKDIPSIVMPLRDQVRLWVAVSVSSKRGNKAALLAKEIANCCNKPCLVCDDIGEAMAFASRSTHSDDVVLITGSFYVVGPGLDWLMTGN